jgi:hypothetical protein
LSENKILQNIFGNKGKKHTWGYRREYNRTTIRVLSKFEQYSEENYVIKTLKILTSL